MKRKSSRWNFIIPESIDAQLHALASPNFKQEDMRIMAGVIFQDRPTNTTLAIATHVFISERNQRFGHVNTDTPGAMAQLQVMANFLHYSAKMLSLPVYPFGCAHSHPPGALFFSGDDLQTFARHTRNYGADVLLTPLVCETNGVINVHYHLYEAQTGQCRPLTDSEITVMPDHEVFALFPEWKLAAFMSVLPEQVLSDVEVNKLKILQTPAQAIDLSEQDADGAEDPASENSDVLVPVLDMSHMAKLKAYQSSFFSWPNISAFERMVLLLLLFHGLVQANMAYSIHLHREVNQYVDAQSR